MEETTVQEQQQPAAEVKQQNRLIRFIRKWADWWVLLPIGFIGIIYCEDVIDFIFGGRNPLETARHGLGFLYDMTYTIFVWFVFYSVSYVVFKLDWNSEEAYIDSDQYDKDLMSLTPEKRLLYANRKWFVILLSLCLTALAVFSA